MKEKIKLALNLTQKFSNGNKRTWILPLWNGMPWSARL